MRKRKYRKPQITAILKIRSRSWNTKMVGAWGFGSQAPALARLGEKESKSQLPKGLLPRKFLKFSFAATKQIQRLDDIRVTPLTQVLPSPRDLDIRSNSLVNVTPSVRPPGSMCRESEHAAAWQVEAFRAE